MAGRVDDQAMKITGYVPFFNNASTVLQAAESLRAQEPSLDEVFAIDDGSSDGGTGGLIDAGIRVIRQPSNLGRGAARHRAMMEARNDLVVCCDATNTLPRDFAARSQHWFEDPGVAAVSGSIADPAPRGTVGRWRARHLFKSGDAIGVRHRAPLITFGAMVRRSAVLEVGNFDPQLRHSEDAELGERLLSAGHDIVFDPSVPVYCNVQNTLGEVLERYWRWHAGPDARVSRSAYWRNIVYSIKAMASRDVRAGDPLGAFISLVCPHYCFWKSVSGRPRRSGTGKTTARNRHA